MWLLLRLSAIALGIIILPVKTINNQDESSLDCKFTLENGTDFKDLIDFEFGINLERIMDTELPGKQLLSVQATNVKAIKTVTSNSKSNKLYMKPILEADRLLLKLTDHFVTYEKNEITTEMTIRVTFQCFGGSKTEIEFIQTIEDTNNHYPEFMNEPYIYTLPMPFPKNIQLNHFQVISARDVDVTNSNISFFLDLADPNVSAFSISWLSRDLSDRKRFYATLVTKAVINFIEDVTFGLYATDARNPLKTSVTNVTIKVDRDNSILRFKSPLYIANLSNLVPEEANGKIIKFDEGEIILGGGVDKTVNFTIHDEFNDYAKNFELIVAEDHSKVSLRLVDPTEKFFLENFIILILKAEKVGSEDTTVFHISLPGPIDILEPPTDPEEDFNLDNEWHYFATAHCKGPCDGVGGTVKIIAARASLQRPIDDQITTAQELYDWASKPTSLPNIAIKFSPEKHYLDAKEKLDLRYNTAKSITGTQKFHSIIPRSNGNILVKEYSSSQNNRSCKIFKRTRK